MKKLKNVTTPTQISLLMEDLSCDNADAANLLIKRTLEIIYGDKEISKKDADAAISLIRGLEVKDTTELQLAAQFVSLNLHGMALMASNYINNKGQAMMLFRLSHNALDSLMRYRQKNPINVMNDGNLTMNTLISNGPKMEKPHDCR